MTATSEILGELRKSGLPVSDQAGLAAIAESEGGITFATLWSGGNLIDPADADHITMIGRTRQWNGGYRQDIAGFPAWSGATTLDGGDFSTAAGPWQITRTTWREYYVKFGLEDFSPRSQIMFALSLARSRFAPFSQILASGNTQMIDVAGVMLAGTWQGLRSGSFAKRFAKNLAALQAPEPVPEPPPQPPLITLEMAANATATDQAGNHIPVTIHFKAMGIVALLLAGAAMGAGVACTPSVSRPQQIAAIPAPEPAKSRKDIFATSTFKLVPGPFGVRAVPLTK